MTRRANVEVVRRSFDAFETADMDAWTADWAPDIEFDVSAYAPWAGPDKHFRGPVEILEFFGRMMTGVRVLKIDLHEISAVDDDRVIALYTETRQEPGGAAPYPLEVGIVYTLRDGRFARVQVHSDSPPPVRGHPAGGRLAAEHRGRGATVRQLTSLDAQFLAMESSSTYGHVGGLALFDPSTAPGGDVTTEDLCRVVGRRIDRLPPYRRRLVEVPLGLDHPYWVDDPDFDLDFHIRDTAVPPPGDDRKLAQTVGRIFARPLDRTRPLWELYLIHGISGGRVGLLTKVHHAAVDGVSGAEILGVLFDLSAEEAEGPARPAENVEGVHRPGTLGPPEGDADTPGERRQWSPERMPSQLEMLGRGLLGLPRQPLRALKSIPAALPAVADFPGAAMMPLVPQLQKARTELERRLGRDDADEALLEVRASRAPRTRFNRRVSPHRRFAFASLPLSDVKALKNELGIKVNDVVVALCATAVRDWLLERDELPEEPLVALVPVSVRTEEEKGTFGNKVSGMILPIPTDVADPRERLQHAHDILTQGKARHQQLPASLMTDVSNFLPPALFHRASRVALDISGRVRPALNLVISNVPGPSVPLYCAGAKMLAHYPVSVITDGVGLNITVMSYLDRIDVGIVADHDSIDDAWTMMAAMEHALDELMEVICGRRREQAAQAAEPTPPVTAG